jgi:hypothetical protein
MREIWRVNRLAISRQPKPKSHQKPKYVFWIISRNHAVWTRFLARRAKGLFQTHFCPRAILPTVRTGPSGAHEPTVDMQN